MLLVGVGGLGGELRLPERARAETVKKTGKSTTCPPHRVSPPSNLLCSGQHDARV